MNFTPAMLFAATTAANSGSNTSASAPEGIMGFFFQYGSLLVLVLMFVAMYFLMIRPQKKKEKETQNMRNNIQIGDEITTIGGVVGIVVALREDTIVLETGSERTKVRFQRWAIQSNNTVHENE